MPSLDKWLNYYVQKFKDAGDIVRMKIEKPNPFECDNPTNLQSRNINFNKILAETFNAKVLYLISNYINFYSL